MRVLWFCMFIFTCIFAENHQPDVPKTSKKLWYHGTLNREEAVKTLEEYCKHHKVEGKASDGVFLVRYSERHTGAYVLTMLSENTPYNFIIRKEVSCISFHSKNN